MKTVNSVCLLLSPELLQCK